MGMISLSGEVNEGVLKKTLDKMMSMSRVYRREQRVTVGIHEEEGSRAKVEYDGSEPGITLAQVMSNHQNGIKTPWRPWLSNWFDQNREENLRKLKERVRKWVKLDEDREAIFSLLSAFGVEMADSLRKWLQTGSGGTLRPLMPFTIVEKGRFGLVSPSTPLYAHGQAADSIRSKVNGRYAK